MNMNTFGSGSENQMLYKTMNTDALDISKFDINFVAYGISLNKYIDNHLEMDFNDL